MAFVVNTFYALGTADPQYRRWALYYCLGLDTTGDTTLIAVAPETAPPLKLLPASDGGFVGAAPFSVAGFEPGQKFIGPDGLVYVSQSTFGALDAVQANYVIGVPARDGSAPQASPSSNRQLFLTSDCKVQP